MNRLFVVFVFCLLATVSVAQDHNGMVGTWVDNFGFTYKLCITEGQTRIEGTYNEFGLIQADLFDFGESASGFFYNTRYQTDDECPWGEFNWHLNGNTIKGQYVCFDHLSGSEWILDRVIPQDRPSQAECYTLNENADDNDIEGAWNLDGITDNDDDWDICISGDQFTASYGEPGDVGSTYQFGRVHENGRVLRGSYLTVIDDYGSIQAGGVLISLTDKSDLVSFNWISPATNARAISAPVGSHFTISGIEKLDRPSDDTDCERNAFLSIGYYDDDDFIPILLSSPANSLTIPLFAIFALVAGVLAF